MVAEATFLENANQQELVALAAIASGEVYQMPDGRAAVHTGLAAAATNDSAGFTTTGQHTVAKTASVAILAGLPVYWDHSANKAHYMKVNDRDFLLGVAAFDAAAADTTVVVNLNIRPTWDVDLLRDAVLSVPTGTQAVGGFGFPKVLGGAQSIELTATSEPQCIDMLSVDRFSVDSKPIAQFIFRPVTNGSGAAVDFSVGLANGTSTTDADAITEHVLFHIDGASTAINAQSKDGTTTVTATDTTKTITAGSAVANRTEVWVDARDKTSVKLYVNGVRVLSATTFVLTAAAGPLGLLFHLEKTTGTTTGQFILDAGRCHLCQQAS